MAVECCGKPRDSRFCPDCGKRLREESTLHGLLAYCRDGEEAHRLLMMSFRGNGDDDWDRYRAKSCEQAAAKWKAWGDALAERLAGTEGG